MNHKIVEYLKSQADEKYSTNLILKAYVDYNCIEINNNKYTLDNINNVDDSDVADLIRIINKHSPIFNFQAVEELFETLIPTDEKITNGAVYTPEFIKNFIINRSISLFGKKISGSLLCDPACGCGGFLISAAEHYRKTTPSTYSSIFSKNIFGIDISKHSVERSKLLLSLWAIIHGEDAEVFNFNIVEGNSLDYNWMSNDIVRQNGGFDLIVGNPPYVRSKNLDGATKKLMKKWNVTSTGIPDLYIPFFEIGIKNLNKNGVLGYITVNTFLKSLNARSLRSYLSKSKFYLEILDFGNAQLFNNKSTYTCLCFFKNSKSDYVHYQKIIPSDLSGWNPSYVRIQYDTLSDDKWLLDSEEAIDNIQKIENTGTPLGKLFEVRNGLATLANDIFIFKPNYIDDTYYYLTVDNKEFKIEKAICRDIIKPNKIRSENQIESMSQKIIFPYDIKNNNSIKMKSGSIKVMEEKFILNNFPESYNYLYHFKSLLLNRDKGVNRGYKWYEYGRSQALTLCGKKLLFAYIEEEPHFILCENDNLLFYCGYGIFSKEIEDLKILKKILESNIFWYYIKKTSKPYSKNYYSLAKNHVAKFGICELTSDEKTYLLNENKKEKIEDFLMKKYSLSDL